MSEIKGIWQNATDRGKWAARGTSLMAKAKATKAVWFPPTPGRTNKKASAKAKKVTKRTSSRTS
jgi:hypothetical protein